MCGHCRVWKSIQGAVAMCCQEYQGDGAGWRLAHFQLGGGTSVECTEQSGNDMGVGFQMTRFKASVFSSDLIGAVSLI